MCVHVCFVLGGGMGLRGRLRGAGVNIEEGRRGEGGH